MTKQPTNIDDMVKEMLPMLEKLASNCEDHMSCESCESAKPIPNTKQRICGLTIVLQTLNQTNTTLTDAISRLYDFCMKNNDNSTEQKPESNSNHKWMYTATIRTSYGLITQKCDTEKEAISFIETKVKEIDESRKNGNDDKILRATYEPTYI